MVGSLSERASDLPSVWGSVLGSVLASGASALMSALLSGSGSAAFGAASVDGAAFGVRTVRVTFGALVLAGAALAPAWAALMASTSWAFFIDPAPETPIPPAIDLRSASSMELRPPPFFLAVVGAAASVDSVT